MQIQKSRQAGTRESFSDYLPEKSGEQDRIESIAPIAHMDPELRRMLVLEMLVRRMERLETLQAETPTLKRAEEAPAPVPAQSSVWCAQPTNCQDNAQGNVFTPRPDIKTAAETYRKIGEL